MQLLEQIKNAAFKQTSIQVDDLSQFEKAVVGDPDGEKPQD